MFETSDGRFVRSGYIPNLNFNKDGGRIGLVAAGGWADVSVSD